MGAYGSPELHPNFRNPNIDEPDYIKCHILKMDGTIKDCNIEPYRFPFDYKKYLHKGELYFRERIKDGHLDNAVKRKKDFDKLVKESQKARPSQSSQQQQKTSQQQQEPPKVIYVERAQEFGGVRCPRCGSNRLNMSSEMTGRKSRHKSMGCLWGIGRAIMIICTCGLWLIFGKRKGTTNTTYSYKTLAICQNCGYSWYVW